MSVTNELDKKKEKAWRLALRQGLLFLVDALEQREEIYPRTSELRKELKKIMINDRKGFSRSSHAQEKLEKMMMNDQK